MRQVKALWRSRGFSQVAFVALLSAGAAGCSSDVSRFGEGPVYTGSTPNQQAILSGQPAQQPYGQQGYGQPAYGQGGYPQGGYGQPAYPQADVTGSVGVQRQSLPPVQVQAAPPVQPYAPAVTATVPQAPRVAVATPQPPRITAAAPAGWTLQGATPVTAQAGDTMDSIARRYGVPAQVLMQSNGISDPSRVAAGQQILIPVYSANAPAAVGPRAAAPAVAPHLAAPTPVAMQPAPAQVLAPPPGARPMPPVKAATAPTLVPNAPAIVAQHTVARGETLEQIAQRYGIRKAALMERNGLKSDTVQAGQKLTLPAGTKVTVRTAMAPTTTGAVPAPMPPALGTEPAARPTQVAGAPAVAPTPAPAAAKPADTKTAAAPAKPTEKQEAAALTEMDTPSPARASGAPPSFRWPVRGRVIGEFGAKAGGDRNDGINLAVPEGTSVKAAEDGEVIYAGNEVKGYGNLVLVRHADGWVSAYAHASDILVNRGDRVNRGQIIARAGATGNVSQPQLHFELRKGKNPVDPKPYLASN